MLTWPGLSAAHKCPGEPVPWESLGDWEPEADGHRETTAGLAPLQLQSVGLFGAPGGPQPLPSVTLPPHTSTALSLAFVSDPFTKARGNLIRPSSLERFSLGTFQHKQTGQ